MNSQNKIHTTLHNKLSELVQTERDRLCEVLLILTEMIRRRTHLELGYSSLYEYLTKSIGYSEGSAQRRIDAVRLIQEFPDTAQKIKNGSLNLNQISMIQKAARYSKKNTPSISHENLSHLKQSALDTIQFQDRATSEQSVKKLFQVPDLHTEKKFTQSDGSVRLELTLSKTQYEKLMQAKNLLSHQFPDGDLAQVIESLSQQFIVKKLGGQRSPITQESLTATAAVTERQRQNILRKNRCCQYISPITGKKCNTEWLIEVDHKQSRWAGGLNKESNYQTLCAQHNKLKYFHESGIIRT